MSSKIRVAVIGVGHLGSFHADVYSRMSEVELVGLVDIEAAVWKKAITLVKSFPCKIRFLKAGDDDVNKNEVVLYRLDVKPLEGVPYKKKDILNTVFLKSSVIKVWVSKESNNIVKISINYKGLEYILTHNV